MRPLLIVMKGTVIWSDSSVCSIFITALGILPISETKALRPFLSLISMMILLSIILMFVGAMYQLSYEIDENNGPFVQYFALKGTFCRVLNFDVFFLPFFSLGGAIFHYGFAVVQMTFLIIKSRKLSPYLRYWAEAEKILDAAASEKQVESSWQSLRQYSWLLMILIIISAMTDHLLFHFNFILRDNEAKMKGLREDMTFGIRSQF